MLKRTLLCLSIFFTGLFSFGSVSASVTASNSSSSNDSNSSECKGVKLNTDFPGVGKCIEEKEATGKFGEMMGSLMKLLVNITIGVAFISLIASGVMMSMSGASQSTAGKGKELIKKVVLGIVLLGLSGLILHTINPNFFVTGG